MLEEQFKSYNTFSICWPLFNFQLSLQDPNIPQSEKYTIFISSGPFSSLFIRISLVGQVRYQISVNASGGIFVAWDTGALQRPLLGCSLIPPCIRVSKIPFGWYVNSLEALQSPLCIRKASSVQGFPWVLSSANTAQTIGELSPSIQGLSLGASQSPWGLHKALT